MSQIEMEGNDPSKTGEGSTAMMAGGAGAGPEAGGGMPMARKGEWGGSEKDPKLPEIDYGKAKTSDTKDATQYAKERYGKREFKGGSPLYPGKGATIVRSESLLEQLKAAFKTNNNDDSSVRFFRLTLT